MKKLFTLAFAMLCLFANAQNKTHKFELKGKDFLLDGKPFQIISGELHPTRIPAEYWRHRIQMAKAMGCNTIAAYIFWNAHEQTPNKFDFTTGNLNIKKFVQICQEEGMWVLFRPGPYVCAEWDFGGIPPYLLKYPDIKIRCMDPRYMKAVKAYVDRISKEMVNLQCTKGGPVLMVQVENEYGSYGNDKEYMKTLAGYWRANGINVPFYTADGATPFMLDAGHLKGAAIGLDPGVSDNDFAEAEKHDATVPVFSSETYPGWLTHWGEKWQKPSVDNLLKDIEYLLKNKKSFNFYVIHGGTNFGFTAGANAFSPTQYQPDVTSYDYDAPIDEQGRATEKYHKLRELIKKYVSYPVPEIPQPVKTIVAPAIEMKKVFNLWDINVASKKIPQPQPMENFGQNQGLISYKTILYGHKSGTLKIWEPHDFALVYLNGKFIDTIYRDGGKWELQLPKTDVKNPELEIVVEGMGHINFAQFMIDRKGITDRVTLNGMTLMNWEVKLYPFNDAFIAQHQNTVAKNNDANTCNFFKGSFNLTVLGDTYFDMGLYRKGIIYVNGHNLGRFWNKGPQTKLFCPASWLKKGKNEVVVFDLLQNEAKPIASSVDLY